MRAARIRYREPIDESAHNVSSLQCKNDSGEDGEVLDAVRMRPRPTLIPTRTLDLISPEASDTRSS